MSNTPFLYKVVSEGFYTTSEGVFVPFGKERIGLIFQTVCELTKSSSIYSRVMEGKATHVLKCGCCKDGASGLFKIESTVAEEETDEVVVPDPDDLVGNDGEDEETLKDPDDVNTKPRTYKEQIEFLDELGVKEHRRKDDNSPKVEASVQKIYEEYK